MFRKVTECVKENLNHHYPGAPGYDPSLQTINKEEYMALARSFRNYVEPAGIIYI